VGESAGETPLTFLKARKIVQIATVKNKRKDYKRILARNWEKWEKKKKKAENI